MKKILYTIMTALMLAMMSPAVMAMPSPGPEISGPIAQGGPQVKVLHGGLELVVTDDSRETFMIYSITGQLVKSVEVERESRHVELPQGCYIVKCSKWAKKVVVK